MTSPVIEFSAPEELVAVREVRPVGAADIVPSWYQALPAFHDKLDLDSTTVKLCRPFSDALELGFLLPLARDIELERSASDLQTATPRAVDIYGRQPSSATGNSTYALPEATIRNPWRIATPTGYSVLITKPLNRDFMTPGIKPFSLFVDTDRYEGPIDIPVRTTDDTISLQRGTPLVQVIPLRRDRLIERNETSSADDRPETMDAYSRKQRRMKAKPDLYRDSFWVQKPRSTVTDGSPAKPDQNGDGTERDQGTDRDASDLVMRQTTEAQNYGVIPEPTTAGEFAPPWIDALPDRLSAESSARGEEIQRFETWMRRACSLGVIQPLHANCWISQGPDGTHCDFRYDSKVIRFLGKAAVGDRSFPGPGALPNIQSEWISELPPGYSNLYTEPFNHHQGYYRAFSGIVDDDRYVDTMNSPGLFVTDEPEFELDVGMPVNQIVPIHRDSIIETGVVSVC